VKRFASSGFSLVEILVASVISLIVMLGIGSIFLTAFTAQMKSLRQARVQIAATQVSKLFSRDMYQTQYIVQPAVGGSGTVLEGYIGIQKIGPPGTVWAYAIPGSTQYTRFLYCIGGASGNEFYRYQDAWSLPAMPTAITPCGTGGFTDKPVTNPYLVAWCTGGAGTCFSRPPNRETQAGMAITITAPLAGGQPPVSLVVTTTGFAQIPVIAP